MIKIESVIKLINSLISWPIWLYFSFFIISSIFYFFPPLIHIATIKTWFGVFSIVCIVLLISKTISKYYEDRKLRKNFQLTSTSNPHECFCYVAEQPDKSIITQLNFKLNVKNLKERPVSLVKANLLMPSVPGELVHSELLVRSAKSNDYGSAERGYIIPAFSLLPISVIFAIRSKKKTKFPKKFISTLNIFDDENNKQKIKVQTSFIGQND